MSETVPAAEATQPAEAEPALRVRIKGEPLARLPDDLYIPPDALEIFLDAFEGPLDLLLYLIRRQNLDIREIPILQITRQYMEYIALMQQLKLELAAEYLLMAAWLAEIKSRVLLPRPSNDEAEDEAACEAAKKKNENVEFVITKVETDKKDITALTGETRTIEATITGDFLLHQKKTSQTAKVKITFEMAGDEPQSVHVETTEPFGIGLAEHDVRPRTAFGQLAEKTLDVLVSEDKKVAQEAMVSLDLTAKLDGMAKGDTKPAGDAK